MKISLPLVVFIAFSIFIAQPVFAQKETTIPYQHDPNRIVTVVVLQAGQKHCKKNPGAETNFQLLADLSRKAATKVAADIIVFPEYALTGWPYPSEKVFQDIAEVVPGDGKWYKKYATLAKKCKCAVLGWFVEKSEGKLYNTAALIDKSGKFVGKYRKVHANMGEQIWWGISQGNSLEPIYYDGVKYGISICSDMWFPETIRCEELLGADIIIHMSVGDDMGNIVPTRAFDSEIPIVLSIFRGGSYAVDSMGKVLGKLNPEKPAWQAFRLQPFKIRCEEKYGGRWIPKLGNQNLRNVEAYKVLTDQSTRPSWTEIFLDEKGQYQNREQLLERFNGRYDTKDPCGERKAAKDVSEKKAK